MKITISPSADAPNKYDRTVSIDTGTNDELTDDIVSAALDACVAAGHAQVNVSISAAQWANDRRPKTDD